MITLSVAPSKHGQRPSGLAFNHALSILTFCVLVQACKDSPAPVTPVDTLATRPTLPGASNLVRSCVAGPSAVPSRSTALLRQFGPESFSVNVGDSLFTYLNRFYGTPDVTLSSVLPPVLGHAFVESNTLHYTAPAGCTGVDSMWVVLSHRTTASLDTQLYVVHVTQPPIAAPESTTVIGGMMLVANRVPGTDDRGVVQIPHPHIAGFLGASRGATQIIADSAVGYTAPSAFSGVDTVRVVFEADYHAVVIRDTALFRFVVLPEATPPTYAVVPVLAGDSTIPLDAVGLSTDGRVAGTATLPNGTTHAFAWTAGHYTELGAYAGARTAGVGINAAGDVAGYARRSDSSEVGLVWRTNGAVEEVPGGRPVPVGISNDGSVLAADGTYWRAGRVVRKTIGYPYGAPTRITYGGLATIRDDEAQYPICYVVMSDGTWVAAAADRSTYFLGVNDAADFLALGVSANQERHLAFFPHLAPSPGALAVPVSPSTIWPETVPPGYTTPPFAVPGNATDPLVLTNDRSYLTSMTVVTTRGAFSIETRIADKAWHLVRAITMNDAGQILALAHNTTTGMTRPVVLTPMR